MKTLVLFAALLAACSPPPDEEPGPAPKVEAIRRAVINSDGPYPARIEVKINYRPDYDDALYRGFYTGTVTGGGTGWTDRSFYGPTYDRAFVCPALWVYLGRPNGDGTYHTVAYVLGVLPYSAHGGRGSWRDANTGFAIQQTLDCSYKVDNVGINRTQNVDYKLWVGLDCDSGGFGGFLPGRVSDIASAVDYWSWDLSPATPPDGPGPRYMIRQAGPGVFGATSIWQSASFACGNTSRRIPSGGSLPNVVSCASFYVAGFCDSWYNLGNLQW